MAEKLITVTRLSEYDSSMKSYINAKDYMVNGLDKVTSGQLTGTTAGTGATLEGIYNTGSGDYSHVEGKANNAISEASHAEGVNTTAGVAGNDNATAQHAEGKLSVASGANSHAQNLGTVAAGENQTAIGKYNEVDNSSTYALIIGNGTSETRHNILTVDWNGNVRAAGTFTDSSGRTLSGIESIKVNSATSADKDSDNQQINTTYIKGVSCNDHTITITKGNGSTYSFNTADNNTTYSSLKNPYSITINGTTYDGSKAVSVNTPNTTYASLKNPFTLTINGTTYDGSAAANITTPNTTYDIVGTKVNNASTADYASNAGTVNGHSVDIDVPSNALFTDTNTTYTSLKNPYALTVNGTTYDGSKAVNINTPNTTYDIVGTKVNNASTADYATNAANGISNITRNGINYTVTRADGSTFTFNQQDNNTTYSSLKNPYSITINGTTYDGSKAVSINTPNTTYDIVGTKVNNASSADYASNAGTVNGHSVDIDVPSNALFTDTNTTYTSLKNPYTLTINGTTYDGSKAANITTPNTTYASLKNPFTLTINGTTYDGSAAVSITTAYIKNISYSGHTVTVTKEDGSTYSFNTADNNTTYSSLKNPYSITINGSTYDGSEAININTPNTTYASLKNPYTLTIMGTTYDGSAAVNINPHTLTIIGTTYDGSAAVNIDTFDYGDEG